MDRRLRRLLAFIASGASSARNVTVRATSSGCITAAKPLPFSISVSTEPGITHIAWSPVPRSSSASDFMKPTVPHFAAQYALWRAVPSGRADAPDGDEAPAAEVEHARQERARDEERALEVHVDDLVPLVVRSSSAPARDARRRRWRRRRRARRDRRRRGRRRLSTATAIGDVARHRDGAAPERDDVFGRAGERLDRPTEQRDVAASLRELDGDRAADAATGAGDDRDHRPTPSAA